MNLQRTILIILFSAICSILTATNYYVSSSAGNDAWDGKSVATAWNTISKVNGMTFLPGDSILFRKGDVWRETLIVPSSGNAAAHLIFASYGTGARPEILGSKQCINWTVYSGNVWVSATTVTDPYNVGSYGAEVFFKNTNSTVLWGVHKASPAACTAEYNWTCSSGKIYIYSPADPNVRYTSVEAPQRTNSVNLNDKNYIDFSGMGFLYVAEAGFTYKTYPMQLHNGLIIENSEVAYISVKGSELGYGIDAGYSDMTVRGCEIHDCGRRGISFHIYGSYNLTNVLIENNYFHDGFHTTGPDFSVGSSSSYSATINGVIIRRNTFYDPPNVNPGGTISNQMFFQNEHQASGASITNISIYSNIFKSPNESSIMLEAVGPIYIYNNTFYNHNTTLSGDIVHVWIDNNSTAKIKNNIFYTTLSNDNGGAGEGLFVSSTQTNTSLIDANYNLYYRLSNSLTIAEWENHYKYYMNTIASLRSQLGWEINSPAPADPKFVSTSDFHLQPGSPALGAGVAIDGITIDFEGNTFSNPPNIGCYSSTGTAVPLTYLSSSVENEEPSVLVMTYNQTLANIVPSASAFTVMVNSVSRTVNSVTVSGTNIQLTLANSVVYGDVITVAYTKPSASPLQTASGVEAATISAQSVTNNVNADIPVSPVYVSSVIQNATPSTLEITYDQTLASIVPPASAFTVMVNSVSRTVSAITVSGTNVQLTLASPVVHGDIVTVAYTIPSSNPLQTDSGGQAVTISAMSVTNNVNAFKLFPNPAHDYFNISISEPLSGDLLIRIENLYGQVVAESLQESDKNYIHVPVNLDPGLYFVDLISGDHKIGIVKLVIY
jgi:uncharacterized repeat protein (TIGR02059 family)